MNVTCMAVIKQRVTPERTYIQAVTVFPQPGLEFSFEPSGGQPVVDGAYAIEGVLEEVTGTSKAGKPFRFLKVTGSATQGAVKFEAAKVK